MRVEREDENTAAQELPPLQVGSLVGVRLGVRRKGDRGGEKTPDAHAVLREIADYLLEVREHARASQLR